MGQRHNEQNTRHRLTQMSCRAGDNAPSRDLQWEVFLQAQDMNDRPFLVDSCETRTRLTWDKTCWSWACLNITQDVGAAKHGSRLPNAINV
jgi:hypothetical protein